MKPTKRGEKYLARYRDYKNNSRFGGRREIVIRRDGENCVKCGMTRIQHKARYGRDITVDHIDGTGRNTIKEKRNNNINNLQTLCLRCHGVKDAPLRRNTLSRYQVELVRHMHGEGHRLAHIAKELNVTPQTISNIVHKRVWK